MSPFNSPDAIALLQAFDDLTSEEAAWWLNRTGDSLEEARRRITNSRLPTSDREILESKREATDDYNAFTAFRIQLRDETFINELRKGGVDEERARKLQDRVADRYGEWWRYDLKHCLHVHTQVVDEDALLLDVGEVTENQWTFIRRFRRAASRATMLEAYTYGLANDFVDVDDAVMRYMDDEAEAAGAVATRASSSATQTLGQDPGPSRTSTAGFIHVTGPGSVLNGVMDDTGVQGFENYLEFLNMDSLNNVIGLVQAEIIRRNGNGANAASPQRAGTSTSELNLHEETKISYAGSPEVVDANNTAEQEQAKTSDTKFHDDQAKCSDRDMPLEATTGSPEASEAQVNAVDGVQVDSSLADLTLEELGTDEDSRGDVSEHERSSEAQLVEQEDVLETDEELKDLGDGK